MSNRVDNLVNMLDAYVADGGYHLNVNVFQPRNAAGRAETSRKNIPSSLSACRGMRSTSTS